MARWEGEFWTAKTTQPLNLICLVKIVKRALLLACLGFLLAASVQASEKVFTHGVVASVNPIATAAGVNALKSGGNAVDAAVAVGLTLGVVDTQNSGIGGGCFMLIHLADGRDIALDGREKAPAAATGEMFVRDGKGDTQLSQTGPLASGVPGELAAFEFAVHNYGKKSLSEIILPAAEIAERGFSVSHSYAERLQSVSPDMAAYPSSAAVFFKDGKPIKAGEILKQPELAATYRSIAAQGSAWFYRGPFAQEVEKWMKLNGGLITAPDFASYTVELREPIETTYRGYRVVSFPPPSSGGVHVLEMLNILEQFDLKKMDETTRLHLIAESMKMAFADRAYWLGDPDFAKVPRGLITKPYAVKLAKKIKLDHTIDVPGHGEPPDWQTDWFKKHTTHFSTADATGNWVACTATINTTFGSKVVIPGTGVVMNDQMDDFSVQPGVPNAFGLVGAEANSVAPGKRPLSSMSPTIVFKDGQPMLALGAAGGPRIITTVLQELVDILDLDMTPAEAVAAPRVHQQWSPDELLMEKAFPAGIRDALAQRGHKIKEVTGGAVSQIVARTPDGKGFVGAADPRAGGNVDGW
jgi:gamma-glutamyltranspeptidase/glutathione hydrolase